MKRKIALAGNPNSGKTTLFNALTGSNQFVGNWPGVTVEKKEGTIKKYNDVILVDLPGIYSLSPYTLEEVIARNYLIDEAPDVILNIVDGTNIERNLYLTTQLIELGIPVVVALNMMDVVKKAGDIVKIDLLQEKLGCRVVEISALHSTGIYEAVDAALEEATRPHTENRHFFSGVLEHALAHIEEAAVHDMPLEKQRWYAVKIFERDPKVLEKLQIPQKTLLHIEEDIARVERALDDDAESVIINERYNYIETILKDCYKKKNRGKYTKSDKIDAVLTNRYLSLPIFAAVIFLVYYISVSTVGTWATEWAGDGVFGDGWFFFGKWVPGIPDVAENTLSALGCADWLQALIIDGIIGGVGAVLSFVPQIFVLFLFLAFLEACGYMARIAFILDKLFRRIGLSGKSFIPLLIGTGCSVPGIMASRTIENESERKMTVITTSFVPCSAKLPVIALIAAALFDGAWWMAPSAYFIGIFAVILSGILLKKTKLFASNPSPFVMELPPYHLPKFRNILQSMWERGWSFIKKAGTIILLATVVIWFASNFGWEAGHIQMVDMQNSILAKLGSLIKWVFIPLGFGNWESTVATLTGLIAKENIVSTMHILSGSADNTTQLHALLQQMFTPISAYSFLVFNLLCAPCVAAIGAIRREMNNRKWTLFAVGYQCALAYIVSFILFQTGTFISSRENLIGFLLALALIAYLLYFIFFKGSGKGRAS